MKRPTLNFSLYFAIFIIYIGYSLIISTFTILFFKEETNFFPIGTTDNIRKLAWGITIFLYPFGRFISSPILGALTDRFGRRPILLLSLLCSMFIFFVLGVEIKMQSIWLIMITLFLGGLTEGSLTIAEAIVADISIGPTRNRLFGYLYISMSLSYIIGPIFGGVVAGTKILPFFSFHIPFYAVSILVGAAFIWLTLNFKETLREAKREQIDFIEAFVNIKNLVLWKRLRFLFFVNGLIYFGIFGFFQGFPLYIERLFAVNVELLGLYIGWVSVPILIVNLWLTGWLADRYSSVKITAISALSTSIFLSIMLAFPSLHALWITLFLVAFAIAICLPASTALLSSFASDEEQGRALGINQSLQFLSESLAGLVVGLLAMFYIESILIIFGAFILLGAFILWKKKTYSGVG